MSNEAKYATTNIEYGISRGIVVTNDGYRATRCELIDYLRAHGLREGPYFHEYTSTYHSLVHGHLASS